MDWAIYSTLTYCTWRRGFLEDTSVLNQQCFQVTSYRGNKQINNLLPFKDNVRALSCNKVQQSRIQTKLQHWDSHTLAARTALNFTVEIKNPSPFNSTSYSQVYKTIPSPHKHVFRQSSALEWKDEMRWNGFLCQWDEECIHGLVCWALDEKEKMGAENVWQVRWNVSNNTFYLQPSRVLGRAISTAVILGLKTSWLCLADLPSP